MPFHHPFIAHFVMSAQFDACEDLFLCDFIKEDIVSDLDREVEQMGS
jgi:hypothetical protein